MVVDRVPTIVAACCVLHNICEIHGDTFNEEWLEDVDNQDIEGTHQAAANSEDGDDIRSALIDYFLQNPL